jgi:hypothetical protein
MFRKPVFLNSSVGCSSCITPDPATISWKSLQETKRRGKERQICKKKKKKKITITKTTRKINQTEEKALYPGPKTPLFPIVSRCLLYPDKIYVMVQKPLCGKKKKKKKKRIRMIWIGL